MKHFVIALFFLLHLIYPSPTLAHQSISEPLFLINGTSTSLYPVPLSSVDHFILPKEIAAQHYLIGETINLEIDRQKMTESEEELQQKIITWDMGDGEHRDGLSITYSYQKPSSYIVHVYEDGETSYLLGSILIHILPEEGYKLPQSNFSINGQTSNDPLLNPLYFDFTAPLSFSSSSLPKTSPIIHYFWDFGDKQSSTEEQPHHRYTNERRQVYPLLRVTDAQGFISDSYLEIQNTNQLSQPSSITTNQLVKILLPLIAALW